MTKQNIRAVPAVYDEITAYLDRVPKFTSKNTPDVTKRYLELLGAPDRTMKIIHVAGTNGKGSVCCYLASILMEAGYTAGAFISPHLVTVRERMTVNGQMIGKEDFVRAFVRVREMYLQASEEEGLPHPSYFEFLFLMFMSWIQNLSEPPDYVILETGLGGRLDSTNTAARKEMTVITRIGMDHMEYLGTTIPEIASEKAGIIRPQVPVVCLEDPPEAFEVIRAKAAAEGAECIPVGCSAFADAQYEPAMCCIAVRLRLPSGTVLRTRLQSPALYQAENAALAAAAIDRMRQQGLAVSDAQIERGLRKASWPGRMEECLPGVFVDGAHNADGIRAFLDSVREMRDTDGQNLLLFSAVRDKQFHVMTDEIAASGLFDRIAAAPMKTGRSLTGEALAGSLTESYVKLSQTDIQPKNIPRKNDSQKNKNQKYKDQKGNDPDIRQRRNDPDACRRENDQGADQKDSNREGGVRESFCPETFPSVREAFRLLMKIKKQNDRIYVAGSLYLVGEIKEILQEARTDTKPVF